MALSGDHEVGDPNHVPDHNLIDEAIGLLQSAVDALEALVPSAPALKSVLTTKGDLFAATGSGVLSRLGVGINGQIVVADSAASTGLRWMSSGAVSGVLPYDPQTGEWITATTTGTSTANAYLTGRMYLEPIDVPTAKTFDRIGTNITATGTGSGQVVRLGIYNDDGTGRRPAGAPLLDAGTVSTTSGTGDKTITISQSLAAKRYWGAWAIQGTVTTSPTVTVLTLVNQMGYANLANASLRCWGMDSVSGALPTIGTLYRDANAPIIGIRAA